MRVFRGVRGVAELQKAVCTVGSYDGVHIGHKALIERCVSRAEEIGGESVVITFEPHPRIVLGRGEGLKILSTIDEKIELLEREGVDNLLIIPFDEEFSRMKYHEFVTDILIKELSMHSMVIGYNHLFGHKNEGNHSLLHNLSQTIGFEVIELAELRSCDHKVSSTTIRKSIEGGDIADANASLGHPYLIIHKAEINPLKLLPAAGRYLAEIDNQRVEIEILTDGKISAGVDLVDKKIFILNKL